MLIVPRSKFLRNLRSLRRCRTRDRGNDAALPDPACSETHLSQHARQRDTHRVVRLANLRRDRELIGGAVSRTDANSIWELVGEKRCERKDRMCDCIIFYYSKVVSRCQTQRAATFSEKILGKNRGSSEKPLNFAV